MEDQTPVTVKISFPKADGFDRVVIVRGQEDDVPEHFGIIDYDDTSVTIQLKLQ